jgi:hypothetical protein
VSGVVYDQWLAGFASLDAETLTAHAVAPAYIPDTAHIDLTDIDPGDLLGDDDATATLTMSAGEARLDVTGVSIDITDTAVGWVVWTWNDGADDLLVAYEPGPVGASSDPLVVTWDDGLLTGTRP